MMKPSISEVDSASHYNTQTLSHIKASMPKISLKKNPLLPPIQSSTPNHDKSAKLDQYQANLSNSKHQGHNSSSFPH